ncbi:peptidase P60 [Martelella alba]|uniref:Peptidase P60 n=1 Tax=Martelella alba TaxID=2590451 RepID=A0A506U7I3_9HYPH|nr:NlpC/P60 family protein [Martelella alba]TPW29438.1 peptidase P60 [Martelella alba]
MKPAGQCAVTLAEAWIGTPYRHQAGTKGVGCDCLGLVRGVWCSLYGFDPWDGEPYSVDWAEHGGEERILTAARKYCGAPVSPQAMEAGDLLVFRWQARFSAKHLGILSDHQSFIHAYEQAGVIRSALVPSWRRRIAAVFRLPEIT